jgi:hypothetical protein
VKNLNDDNWRLMQLLKSTANPAHPFHKFGTGSLETLDVIPKQKGIDVLDQLKKFYNAYYSSNLMRLVVIGRGTNNCIALQFNVQIVLHVFREANVTNLSICSKQSHWQLSRIGSRSSSLMCPTAIPS